MKTKLVGTVFRGSASVDPRFSAPMLKWIITDVRNRGSFSKLSIGIENGVLETYNTDFELQFKHQIKHIIGMCLISTHKVDIKNLKIANVDKVVESNFMQIIGTKNGFVYLLKIPIDPLLHIYLYETESLVEIINLMQSIQTCAQTSINDNSCCVQVSGQIPQNIISTSADANDDSLKKILGRNGVQTTPASNLKLTVSIKHQKGGEFGRLPKMSTSKSFTSGFNQSNKQLSMSNSSTMTNLCQQSDDASSSNHCQFFEVMFVQKIDCIENYESQTVVDEMLTKLKSNPNELMSKIEEISGGEPSTSVGDSFEQNRIMVLMIGQDLRLISPDRKQILLTKNFINVSAFCQGKSHHDHFVLIFRSMANIEQYTGYIFKCQTKAIVDDIMSGISLMTITKKKENYQVIACESCPMLWYHNLCVELENLNEKRVNSSIRSHIDRLSPDEQNLILTKFNGVDEVCKSTIAEQNHILMMLLRAHCEYKNERHIHDLEGNKHFFTQPLSSKTFFMKAKRSLTSSFDHLLKRKNNRDEFDGASTSGNRLSVNIGDRKLSESGADKESGGKSPTPSRSALHSPAITSTNETQNYAKSWRQEIFQRVITPSKNASKSLQDAYFSPLQSTPGKLKTQVQQRSAVELKELWQTAIKQVILLLRMEKENAQLQAKQNENEIKRIKLEYEDISVCVKDAAEIWDELIKMKNQNRLTLLQAIKNGVPRHKRGEIWLYLAEQQKSNSFGVDHEKFPNFKAPYGELLKSFTEHQHAIFIDLGRTFPNHKFYKQSLGVGQLSLFNLLKAYSILDPELGYCQGLGFICGILLLHLDEVEAFEMLKYLMFDRQMRLKYLPEMKQFQLQLYQLSRLIKDYLPDLYDWLEQKDISTTLFAAPWILTIFSSQFSLGFVTRVFDLLFLESSEILFKVSLALLIIHKNFLLKLDVFEDIIDYLKNVVPKVDSFVMERVLKIVFTTNITVLLNEYQIEYNVLQEEITTQNLQADILERTKKENQNLYSQLQMAQSCIRQLEEIQFFQKSQIEKLQHKVKNFELTIESLQSFINLLIELNRNLDIPVEIKNFLLQLNEIELNEDRLNDITFTKENNDRIVNFIENKLKEANAKCDNDDGSTSSSVSSGRTENRHLTDETIKFLERIRDHLLKNNLNLKLRGGSGGVAHKWEGYENGNRNNVDIAVNLNGNDDSGVSTPISP